MEFSTFREPVAKKPHVCSMCGREINIGEKYIRFSGKDGSYMFDIKLHEFCNNVIDKYCKHVGENEYDNDAVIDWLRDTVCTGCKYFEDDNDEPPCKINIFNCERIKNYF